MAQLDELDVKATEYFDGYLVRKDLATQFRAGTRYRPTSGSSFWDATALPPTKRRSPKASRSSLGS